MNRAVRFTKAEIANAAAVARAHGVVVKLNKDGSLTVFPEVPKLDPLDVAGEDDLDAELAAFEAKHGDG